MSDEDVLFERRGRLALVTLNRPEALNALTLEMAGRISAVLAEWAVDASVDAVLVKGAGGRAFCAGGDIRRMYDVRGTGDPYPFDFFRTEYVMNARVFHFPKPYVALMDGIVMGGGVGLSLHGSHRVASERLMLAMPETGIGLFPDVGASYALPRLPGEAGMFMALTGARLGAADASALGIAGVYVPSERLEALEAALAEAELGAGGAAVRAVIAAHVGTPGPAPLAPRREAIDACFAAGSVEAILDRLAARGEDWAQEQIGIIATKSPTSLKVTFEAMRRGARLDFDSCMAMEYRIANGCVHGHDFYEGIRAAVVDKDRKPAWRPASLAEVGAADVAYYFDIVPFGGDLEVSA